MKPSLVQNLLRKNLPVALLGVLSWGAQGALAGELYPVTEPETVVQFPSDSVPMPQTTTFPIMRGLDEQLAILPWTPIDSKPLSIDQFPQLPLPPVPSLEENTAGPRVWKFGSATPHHPTPIHRTYSKTAGRQLVAAIRGPSNRPFERGVTNHCYTEVKIAIWKVLGMSSDGAHFLRGHRFLDGVSAEWAAVDLAWQKKLFYEIPLGSLKNEDLPRLPAGAIVVWKATDSNPWGHISIADGKGNEMSDFIAPQNTWYEGYDSRGRPGFRVFLPRF